MKFKSLLSVFTAMTMLFTGAFTVNSAAAYKENEISYKISYSSKYTYLVLEPSDPDNTIRYTIDGSAPDENSTIYRRRLRASRAVTLRIAEFDENGDKVDTLKIGLRRKCQKVQVSLKEKKKGYKVTLSTTTEGADIYYTTDGSKPTTKSEKYDGEFTVKEGDIIHAYAVKDDWKKSAYTKYEISGEAEEDDNEYDETALEILELVNEYRADKGLSPLKMNADLYDAAQIRAEELSDSYSHIRPDDSDWYTVLEEVDFVYSFAGENIAYTEGTLSTPEKVMELWMDSTAHRENILNTSGSLIGISVYKSGNRTYWVQLFGEKR